MVASSPRPDSEVQPVRRFDQKGVVRPRPEQIPEVARRDEAPGIAIVLIAALSPNQENGRARPVLPPRYRARMQLLDVEARIVRGEREGPIAVLVSGGAWRRELAQSEVSYRRQEWLGVKLQRHGRRRCVVEPAGEAE